jgi:hypothetical protein
MNRNGESACKICRNSLAFRSTGNNYAPGNYTKFTRVVSNNVDAVTSVAAGRLIQHQSSKLNHRDAFAFEHDRRGFVLPFHCHP